MSTAPKIEDIAAIVRRHVPDERYRIVLFGSRARGDNWPTSDWDIGILGPRKLGSGIVQEIQFELDDMRTLHTIEIVDFQTVSDMFRSVALQDAVKIG